MSPADELVLTSMWLQLNADKDLASLFRSDEYSLADVLNYFRQVTYATESDGAGAWVCIWFEPFFDGVWVGVWVAPRCRKTKKALAFVKLALEHALKAWPVLFCATRQSKVNRIVIRLGFTAIGKFDKMANGQPVWLSCMEAGDVRSR